MLVRFGGSAYDMDDVSAIARKLAGLWRPGLRRMVVVIKGGVSIEAEGEDAAALEAFVASLPMYGAASEASRDVIARPGIVHPRAGEQGS